MEQEYVEGKTLPRLFQRWWLRSREVEPIRHPDGSVGACHELYAPWWAKPLDYLHGLIFGEPNFELVEGE